MWRHFYIFYLLNDLILLSGISLVTWPRVSRQHFYIQINSKHLVALALLELLIVLNCLLHILEHLFHLGRVVMSMFLLEPPDDLPLLLALVSLQKSSYVACT